MTCERSRASGTIRPALKTVYFTTPFSSTWPLDVLHFGKLGRRSAMLFRLRAPFPGMRFGVRAELRVPKIRGCTEFALLQFGLGLALFLFPRSPKMVNFPRTGPTMAQRDPDLPFGFGLGLVFGVSNRTKILLARTTRNCLGRMKTSREQETGINLRDVCVQQQQKRDNLQFSLHWRRWAAFA